MLSGLIKFHTFSPVLLDSEKEDRGPWSHAGGGFPPAAQPRSPLTENSSNMAPQDTSYKGVNMNHEDETSVQRKQNKPDQSHTVVQTPSTSQRSGSGITQKVDKQVSVDKRRGACLVL